MKENLLKKLKKNKVFYNYKNSKRSKRVAVGSLKHDGELVTDCGEICNKKGDFFRSVFSKDEVSDTNNNIEDLTEQKIEDVTITEDDIKKKLKSLKPFSSSGPDNISTKILILASDEIAALHLIFQKSLNTGTLPNDWKKAKIVPVFKKVSRFEVGNYRPLFLTSVICKVMKS